MKLIVCDVEGTIFEAKYRIDGTEYASTLWQPIAQALGDEAVNEELITHKKWENLQYNNYLEWVEESIKIHRKYGLEERIFNSLIKEATYKPGVVEFFKKLDRNEYIPVLVSGGFQNLIERAQKELNIKYGFGACKYIFGNSGKLIGYNLQPTDFKDKINLIHWLFDHYGLDDKKDWIYVGDGKNDKYIAQLAPISFGIDPHPELEGVVDYIITSFDEILPNLQNLDFNDLKTNHSRNMMNTKYNPATRIEKLEKDNSDLRKYNNKLRKQLDELIQSKHDDNSNHVRTFMVDYSNKPKLPLNVILENTKIVIIGLTQRESSYYLLSNYNKNLKIIEGFDKTYDTAIIRNADFIFKIISVMSHTVGYKAEKELVRKPHSELEGHRNAELLINAISNTLIRYYNLS